MQEQEEAGGTPVVGWNQAAMFQRDWEHAGRLRRERARGRAYLGVESTGGDAESEAEWSQVALGKVLNATAKKIVICAHSKGWWNGEIKLRRSPLGKKTRRRCRLAESAQGKDKLQ